MKRNVLSVLTLACAGLMSLQASAQEVLTVWWDKGYYKAENDAIMNVIKKFEAKHKGLKVELTQYPVQDMITKTIAAAESGNPPDVAYGDNFDFQTTATWAYQGKLEDISSVIDPIRSRFATNTVETTFLFNNKDQKRSYYAFPVKQSTIHVQYWRDMLEQAGFKESDIPTTWKEYWNFWCDKVQPAYRQKTGQRAFGVGQPMGVESSDAYISFLAFVDAHNVKLVNDSGKLLVDDPDVRKGLIAALADYTALAAKGCTPPSSTTWKDPDNNVSFHNKTTIMTHNATISIAAKWLDDSTNASLTEAQRATAKQNYTELIRTASFPAKPDGSKMVFRAAIKNGVVFKEAKNKARAKEFVAFFLQEDNLTPYIENSLGRWFPVTKAAQQSKFWQQDPHRQAVHKQFMAGTTTFEITKNFRFTQLNNENVWAKAMNRVVNEKVSVEQATDEMIARIKDVAGKP